MAALIAVDAATHAITGFPEFGPWGWSYSTPPTNPILIVSNFWMLGLLFLSLVLGLVHIRRVKTGRLRVQAILVVSGYSIGFVAALTESIRRSSSGST